jgi:hypothetical protein
MRDKTLYGVSECMVFITKFLCGGLAVKAVILIENLIFLYDLSFNFKDSSAMIFTINSYQNLSREVGKYRFPLSPSKKASR